MKRFQEAFGLSETVKQDWMPVGSETWQFLPADCYWGWVWGGGELTGMKMEDGESEIPKVLGMHSKEAFRKQSRKILLGSGTWK